MRKKLTSNKKIAKELQTEMAIIAKLTNLVKQISLEADLDQDILGRRIASANKHEYGTTAGLINLITAIVLWPVDKDGSMDSISSIQDAMLEVLNSVSKSKNELTLVFFERLKESRGSHTFLGSDGEPVPGKEPEYDRYAEMLVYLADALDVEVLDYKLEPSTWNSRESSAIEATKMELLTQSEEFAKHESEMAALEAKIAS